MDILEKRLWTLEKNLGNLPPNETISTQIDAIRAELDKMKMNLVLTTPLSKLKELSQFSEPESLLTVEEKMITIEMSEGLIDRQIRQLQEMEKLSKLVFESHYLKKLPNIEMLDSLKDDINDFAEQVQKLQNDTFLVMKNQTDAVNQIKNEIVQLKQLAKQKKMNS